MNPDLKVLTHFIDNEYEKLNEFFHHKKYTEKFVGSKDKRVLL